MGDFYGKAVLNGQLRYVSVSAVKQYDRRSKGGCPRRWWYTKIGGKREEEAKSGAEAKAKGIKLDGEIKHYLETGDKSVSALALKGLHILDKPGKDLWINLKLHAIDRGLDGQPLVRSELSAAGVPFVGEIDYAHARGHFVDDDGTITADPAETVEVCDVKFKTTAKDRNGNATFMHAADLVRDIQMAGYGEWFRRVRPQTQHVRLSHLYFPEKGGLPTKVTRLHVIQDVQPTWAYVDTVVAEMKQAAAEANVENVPYEASSCNLWAGCPHREYCTAYERTSLDNLYSKIADDFIKEPEMGLLANNPQILQQTAPAAPAAPAPDMRAQLAAEEQAMRQQAIAQQQLTAASLSDACQRILAAGYGFPTLAGNAAQAYAQLGGQAVAPGFVYQGQMAMAGARRSLHAITLTEPQHLLQLAGELDAERASAPAAFLTPQVMPPPAPPPVQAPVAPPMPAASFLPPGAPESMPQLAALPPKPEEAPAAPAPVEEVKKTRGRPAKKAQDTAPEATAAVAAPAPQAAIPPIGVPAPQAPPVTASTTPMQAAADTNQALGSGDAMVLINARSVGIATKSLAGYVDYINGELARRYSVTSDGKPGIQDVRCVPKDSPLAFGGWKGAVREVVKADPPPPGCYHFDTHMDELNEAVADALRVVADQRGWLYVRGVR